MVDAGMMLHAQDVVLKDPNVLTCQTSREAINNVLLCFICPHIESCDLVDACCRDCLLVLMVDIPAE